MTDEGVVSRTGAVEDLGTPFTARVDRIDSSRTARKIEMARVKRGVAAAKRRKRVLKRAKGYYGARSKLVGTAKEAVDKAGVYAYIGRKLRKREFRRLWITRINAACREQGMSYSRFISGLKSAGVEMDRKVIAELAVSDPTAFTELVKLAKAAAA
jgi:large subunit ribosomal protein L20